VKKMRKRDAEKWQQMAARFNIDPFATMIGMRIVELDRGYAKVELSLRPEHDSRINRPHGGLISTLLDHACGNALDTMGRDTIGVQLSVNYIAGTRPNDTLTAEARVVHLGKTMGTAEATLTGSDGTVIAKALNTAMVFKQ
jgi:acyl-CoA thioesterase